MRRTGAVAGYVKPAVGSVRPRVAQPLEERRQLNGVRRRVQIAHQDHRAVDRVEARDRRGDLQIADARVGAVVQMRGEHAHATRLRSSTTASRKPGISSGSVAADCVDRRGSRWLWNSTIGCRLRIATPNSRSGEVPDRPATGRSARTGRACRAPCASSAGWSAKLLRFSQCASTSCNATMSGPASRITSAVFDRSP